MQNQRFLLALVLSAVILFGWSYFFSPKAPLNNNANSNQTKEATPTPAQSPITAPATPQNPAIQSLANDQTPRRTITVSSPLYEVKLDTRGAVAVSWILKKNRDTGSPIYSVGGTKSNPMPMQLISAEGLKREDAPLKVVTGEASIDQILALKNYQLANIDGAANDVSIGLSGVGETKTIEFVMRDQGTGIDITKALTFHSNEYVVDVSLKLSKGGQAIPSAKLLVGPNIGDHGIHSFTFYSVAPEGLAVVNGEKVSGLQAVTINHGKESPDLLKVPGRMNWAGVGDTYFAMLAVPPSPAEGLEYRTLMYEHQANGITEPRHLVSAFVPIPTTGQITKLYSGPKDHYNLVHAIETIASTGGAVIDLDQSIDYGFGATISRPIAIKLLWCIKKLNEFTGSYGIAIIIFTIFIYSLFFPLKWRSSKSMKKAQKLAPRMKEIQEKIKGLKQNDPRLKELQSEQLKLMKEGNPLGGCLPLLIQMPFLFALYRAITISLDFRLATFLWLPDLSASDPTHVLPIAFAGSMVVLQLITPAPSADPLQRKMMVVMMPAMMLWMMWSAPSGLLVYWLVGNLVGFGQQMLINKLTSRDDTEPPAATPVNRRTAKKLSPAGA